MKLMILNTNTMKIYKTGDEVYLVDWKHDCNLDGINEECVTSITFDEVHSYVSGGYTVGAGVQYYHNPKDTTPLKEAYMFASSHSYFKSDFIWWNMLMNLLLDCLYLGCSPDEECWTDQYSFEIDNMINDCSEYVQSLKDAGIKPDVESFAKFLVYMEATHLGNLRFIQDKKKNLNKLQNIAAAILKEIEEESK